MKSNNRLTIGTLGAVILAISVACSPANQTTDSPRRQSTGDTGGTGDDTSGGTGRPKRDRNQDENTEAAAKFFDEKVQPVFRNTAIPRCIECHDAPRNTLGNPDAADTAIYEFTKMYALLKDGPYANENELINTLLGNRNHPGARICRTEQDATCALVIEWWNVAFGDAAGGAVKLGEIQTVSPRGQVSGYAMDASDMDKVYQVRLYLDGDKDTGTFLEEVAANRSTQINGLQQQKGFAVKIPDAMINNTERVVHAYALVDGEEVELTGSPFQFIAYAPKGLAVVGNAFPNNATGCGCHAWSYETLYGALLTPAPRDGGKADNNELYLRMSGARDHPQGGNAGIATASMAWWDAEFNN
ncbi:MAG: hypothetical protein ACOH5I_21775 [Oligoflexus sp.]